MRKQDDYTRIVTLCSFRVTLLSQKGNNTFPLYCCDTYAAVNNIKVVSVAMEMQQIFSFALLSNNATFRTATDTINVLRASRKTRHISVRFGFIGASRQT